MIGLCHFCLTSNLLLFPIKGIIRCYTCIGKIKPPEVLKQSEMLLFEDLPEASADQRNREHVERSQKEMNKVFLEI